MPEEAENVARPNFASVFDTHFNFVWNTLRRLGVHPDEAEDVAQDVFVIVHRKQDAYDPTRPIRPWLYGIAVREARDHRRLARHKREISDADSPEPTVEARQPAEIERKEAHTMVDRILDELSSDHRDIFVLHAIDEVAMTDVASALELPLQTAYSRAKRAREEFDRAGRRLLRGQAQL